MNKIYKLLSMVAASLLIATQANAQAINEGFESGITTLTTTSGWAINNLSTPIGTNPTWVPLSGVAAGSATRDALGSVVSTIPSIPRPFDEKEVAKDLSQIKSTQPKTSWRNTDKKMQEDDVVAEWGAAGTAVGPGNDDADPVEIAAQRAQQVAGKQDQQNQVAGLIAQVNGARSELAGLNKQFPQGANPVEKAMSLQQMQGQRVALGRQIEDLMSQVASLRSQA